MSYYTDTQRNTSTNARHKIQLQDEMESQGSQGSQDSTLTITDENRSEILYFAYGSNLSTEQMRRRCPYSTAVGLGKVTGWRWIINARGYANIVREEEHDDENVEKWKSRMEDDAEQVQEESQVYGMLYLLPVEDEERLDQHEGVPWAYEKLHIEASWVSNTDRADGEQRAGEELTPVKVLAYVDRQRVAEGRPKEEYVERMERGIEDAVGNWGMSEEYADRVMRRFWVDG
ncbi:uncharacterized protein Triagg1_5285 [Trichoderma aggressivum f. europaeum]|uniref:gamma-glutamylcyclotransferase n=1 Tax=Trichoderma aggressivum f. europaeum TaxID=173218 RepID=A0AAE1J6A5_9HYPO|nr:hypothetical protein Triagg1_5285 [Trichoderma aggressivum f. europaeum]